MSPAWALRTSDHGPFSSGTGGSAGAGRWFGVAVGPGGVAARRSPDGPGTRCRGGPATCAASAPVYRAGPRPAVGVDRVEGPPGWAGPRGFAGPLGGVAGTAVGDARVGAPGAGRVRPVGGTGAGRSTPVEAVSLRSSRGARIGRVMTPDRPREQWCRGPRNRPRRTDDSRHATPSGELDARPVGSRVESAVAAEHTTGSRPRIAHGRSPSASTAERMMHDRSASGRTAC